MSEAKQNSAAGLQHACEPIEIDGRDEAALPVFPLRPGIGIEQVDLVDRAFRQPVEHLRRVVVVKADVFSAALLDMPDQLCHGIDEGFDTDETGRRVFDGPVDQVLAAAEADFQPDPLDGVLEQRLDVRRRGRREIEPENRQHRFQMRCLQRAQRLALAASEEGFGRAAAVLFGHGNGLSR